MGSNDVQYPIRTSQLKTIMLYNNNFKRLILWKMKTYPLCAKWIKQWLINNVNIGLIIRKLKKTIVNITYSNAIVGYEYINNMNIIPVCTQTTGWISSKMSAKCLRTNIININLETSHNMTRKYLQNVCCLKQRSITKSNLKIEN